ncbi:MAG TPA: apolipoprotein N-acyltransferase [Polyangia bacterium]|nr:apolipoprotein N-acyltransferase [Polyangia bacterium]
MRVIGPRLGLSILAGVLLFLAVPTYGLWPLMWIAMAPQIYVARTAATPRRAFFYGWLTGFVANTGGFYWMDGLLQRFGHMPLLEALPIMALLIGYQGLEFALFSWGVRRLRDRTRMPFVLLAPLVMVSVELLTPQIFPYYLGISQAFVPAVIQIADLTGPLGVTALMLAFAGALADLQVCFVAGSPERVPQPSRDEPRSAEPGSVRASSRRAWPAWRGLAIAGALIAFDLIYGAVRIHQVDARRAAAPKVKTGLVQANVGIIEKWDPAVFARLLALHQEASAQLAHDGAQLMVWPESSYPYPLPRTFAHDFPLEDGRRVRRGFDTPLLFGALTETVGPQRTRADRYPYNTAIMMNADGDVTATYDKVFLMMFGEYIPFYDQIPWFTDLFPEASNFSRGSQPGSFPLHLPIGDFKLGPLICYEDILPSFARRVAQLQPNAFVNITNDAWFGRTAEPYQHLALAVFRTVENRLEMVRAVNTGVSAHLDAAGRVLAKTVSVDPDETPHPEPKTLLCDLALLPGGGLYRAIGDLFGYVCLVVLLALALAPARRRRPT